MSAKLEKIENNEAYLEVEIDAETFEEGLEKAYKKVVKQVAIPGFRKGRVPRQLMEAHFGREILYEDALEYVVPDAYEAAIEELDIQAIARPEIEILEVESGKPVKFSARVAVKPEVTLGQLEGLEIEVPSFEVSEADIDARLEEMQARYAQMIDKTDGEVVEGDTVFIDFKGYLEGTPFEGGEGQDYQLEIGSHTFVPGFEEQIIGMKVGETRDVNVTFPEDYTAEELAGKETVFTVTVNKIQTKQLRDLDDEFAQEVSNFDTLEELRQDIERSMREMLEQQLTSLKKEAVLNKAVALCEMDLPDAVVEMQLEGMMEQFAQRLAAQGLSLEQYFQLSGMSVDAFKQELWPDAEKNARITFMLEKIIEEKGIEASDEEIDQHIQEAADGMGIDFEQAKESVVGVLDNLAYNIKVDKAIQYLVDHAVISEVKPEEAGEENPEGEVIEVPAD